MITLESNGFVMNMWLFKTLSLYHLFRPGDEIIFGLNPYRLTLACCVAVLQCLIVYGSMGFLTWEHDEIDSFNWYNIIYLHSVNVLVVSKAFVLLRKSDDVWALFDVTSTRFMTSERCRKHYARILHKYFGASSRIMNVMIVLLVLVYVCWNLFLVRQPNVVTSPSSATNATERDENLINMSFPTSAIFYNRYYWLFFTIESIVVLTIMLIMLIYVIVFVLFSCAMIAQHEIIARAFEDVGHGRESSRNDKDATDIYAMDSCYDDIISILIDRQQLHTKLKLFYSNLWYVTLMTIAMDSNLIIFLTYTFIVISTSSTSLQFISIVKLITAALFIVFELFLTCFSMEIINNTKESIRFAMYSCNWTAMDLRTKKLLLLSMRMEDSINLMLKVMITSYNIVSVMWKSRSLQ